MKSLLTLVILAVSSGAWAQEIGTESPPPAPPPGTQPPTFDNPFFTPPSKGNPTARTNSPTAAQAPPAVSAAQGAFGIRAGFGGGAGTLLATGAGSSIAAPTVGISYWATDSLTILFDLGLGLTIANDVQFAAAANLGLDIHLRKPDVALRPLINVGVGFGMVPTSSNSAVGLSLDVGGGAEYFFSPSFSVRGTVGLTVPMFFSNSAVFGVFTFTPGVGAAFYF